MKPKRKKTKQEKHNESVTQPSTDNTSGVPDSYMVTLLSAGNWDIELKHIYCRAIIDIAVFFMNGRCLCVRFSVLYATIMLWYSQIEASNALCAVFRYNIYSGLL